MTTATTRGSLGLFIVTASSAGPSASQLPQTRTRFWDSAGVDLAVRFGELIRSTEFAQPHPRSGWAWMGLGHVGGEFLKDTHGLEFFVPVLDEFVGWDRG